MNLEYVWVEGFRREKMWGDKILVHHHRLDKITEGGGGLGVISGLLCP